MAQIKKNDPSRRRSSTAMTASVTASCSSACDCQQAAGDTSARGVSSGPLASILSNGSFSTTHKRQRPERSIQWDTIEIREYPLILGDNPSVSAGPPLTIGWTEQSQFIVDLEDYEDAKPPPRLRSQMRFDEMLRLNILLSSGYPLNDIFNATLSVRRIQEERYESAIRDQHQMFMCKLRMEQTKAKIRRKLPTLGKVSGSTFANKNLRRSYTTDDLSQLAR